MRLRRRGLVGGGWVGELGAAPAPVSPRHGFWEGGKCGSPTLPQTTAFASTPASCPTQHDHNPFEKLPRLAGNEPKPRVFVHSKPQDCFWPSPAPTGEKVPHHPAETCRKRSTNSPFGQRCMHVGAGVVLRERLSPRRPAGPQHAVRMRACQTTALPPQINCPSTNKLQAKVSCYSQGCSDAWQDLNANPGQRVCPGARSAAPRPFGTAGTYK